MSISLETPTSAPSSIAPDNDPRRWRILALLSLAELFGMSLWFAASAVASQLGARWTLSVSELGWLTAIVQLGFVVGTATSALFNLGRYSSGAPLVRRIRAGWRSGQRASRCGAELPGRVGVQVFHGVRSRRRLSAGNENDFDVVSESARARRRNRRWCAHRWQSGSVSRHAIPGAGENPVVLSASIAAILASVLVTVWYVDGPYPFPPRPFSWSLVATVFNERQWRLATGGYLGHMFELYSAWTWLPVFVAASATAAGMPPGPAQDSVSSAVTFAAIAIGGIGCVWGGRVADRRGREWLVTWAMARADSVRS
jgi:hypothetical protein